MFGPYWELIEDNTRLLPVRIMDNVIAASSSPAPVYGSSGNTLVIRSDGSLWGWGSGLNSGPIPYHRNTWFWFNPVPAQILDDVTQIIRGESESGIFAITSDGNLWDLSNGTVWVMDDVAGAAVDWHNRMALRTDGSLWVWESNGSHQFGYSTEARHLPAKIKTGVLVP